VATHVQASEKAIEQLKYCAKAMMKNVEGRDMEVLREGLVSPTYFNLEFSSIC
jgi:hypothetical protein